MPESKHLPPRRTVGERRRANDPPDLESRVRELELWAVATHGQIDRMQQRSAAMEPVVIQLQQAAESGAAVAAALEASQTKRRTRITSYIGWGAGAAGIVGLVIKRGLIG